MQQKFIEDIQVIRIGNQLMEASKQGLIDEVKELSVHFEGIEKSFIHISFRLAAAHGHLAVVQFLANFNVEPDFIVALSFAIEKGHLEIVKFILSLPTVKTRHKNDAFQTAAEYRQFEVLRYLASLPDLSPQAGKGNFFIQTAAEKGDLALLKFLASLPELDLAVNDNYPVKKAAENGHLDVVQFLLTFPEINPAAADNYAILKAAENGHLSIVKLLSSRPGVNPALYNEKAIYNATLGGHLGIVKFLVSTRTSADTLHNTFVAAAQKGHLEIVSFLLKKPTLNVTQNYCHAVRMAAFHNQKKVIEFLLLSSEIRKNCEITLKMLTHPFNGKATLINASENQNSNIAKFAHFFLWSRKKEIPAEIKNHIVNTYVDAHLNPVSVHAVCKF